MAGPKSVFEMVQYLRPKSPRKIIEPRVLKKRVCLFADTLTGVVKYDVK